VNKHVARLVFISLAVISVIVSVLTDWFSDERNTFLRNFVNQELLNLLGVVLAITLASVASLQVAFDKVKDNIEGLELSETRNAVKSAIMSLNWTFLGAVLLVVIKPLMPTGCTPIVSLVNATALLLVIYYGMTLMELTILTFKMPSLRELKAMRRSGDANPENHDDAT